MGDEKSLTPRSAVRRVLELAEQARLPGSSNPKTSYGLAETDVMVKMFGGNLSVPNITKEYRRLQLLVHPDKNDQSADSHRATQCKTSPHATRFLYFDVDIDVNAAKEIMTTDSFVRGLLDRQHEFDEAERKYREELTKINYKPYICTLPPLSAYATLLSNSNPMFPIPPYNPTPIPLMAANYHYPQTNNAENYDAKNNGNHSSPLQQTQTEISDNDKSEAANPIGENDRSKTAEPIDENNGSKTAEPISENDNSKTPISVVLGATNASSPTSEVSSLSSNKTDFDGAQISKTSPASKQRHTKRHSTVKRRTQAHTPEIENNTDADCSDQSDYYPPPPLPPLPPLPSLFTSSPTQPTTTLSSSTSSPSVNETIVPSANDTIVRRGKSIMRQTTNIQSATLNSAIPQIILDSLPPLPPLAPPPPPPPPLQTSPSPASKIEKPMSESPTALSVLVVGAGAGAGGGGGSRRILGPRKSREQIEIDNAIRESLLDTQPSSSNTTTKKRARNDSKETNTKRRRISNQNSAIEKNDDKEEDSSPTSAIELVAPTHPDSEVGNKSEAGNKNNAKRGSGTAHGHGFYGCKQRLEKGWCKNLPPGRTRFTKECVCYLPALCDFCRSHCTQGPNGKPCHHH